MSCKGVKKSMTKYDYIEVLVNFLKINDLFSMVGFFYHRILSAMGRHSCLVSLFCVRPHIRDTFLRRHFIFPAPSSTIPTCIPPLIFNTPQVLHTTLSNNTTQILPIQSTMKLLKLCNNDVNYDNKLRNLSQYMFRGSF